MIIVNMILRSVLVIWKKCYLRGRNYGVKKIYISGLVFSTKVSLPILEKIHKKFVEMSVSNT